MDLLHFGISSYRVQAPREVERNLRVYPDVHQNGDIIFTDSTLKNT
jgi:hypothetical protein